MTATAPSRSVEEVFYLQNYREGWTGGKWEEKMDVRECNERTNFVEVSAVEY